MPVSFFSRTSATNVWKSVISVSSAGSKRGRGKGMGRNIAKDLNKGQKIGVGRKKLILGGLNAPVVTANKYTNIQDIGDNKEFENNLQIVRQELSAYRKFREHPMERGWSGRKAHGRYAGPPSEHNETSFDDFDSIVLMLKSVNSMTGNLGRTRRMHGLVVTGNKNGIIGFSTAIGNESKTVVRHARNRAAQNLVLVPRWENRTVMHDFFSRYYYTTVFVERKPKGYGVRAHRIIKAICEMVGITDLYAKVEGVTHNQINLTKAFFLGLMNQRKYQDIANEKKLHLVEMNENDFFYPRILASPNDRVLTDQAIKNSDENLDFVYYIYDGKIKQVKPKYTSRYVGDGTWYKHLDRLDFGKNREKTKLILAARYGDTLVKDVFPYFRTTANSFNKPQNDDA